MLCIYLIYIAIRTIIVMENYDYFKDYKINIKNVNVLYNIYTIHIVIYTERCFLHYSIIYILLKLIYRKSFIIVIVYIWKLFY